MKHLTFSAFVAAIVTFGIVSLFMSPPVTFVTAHGGGYKTDKKWEVTNTGACVSKNVCGSKAGTKTITYTCTQHEGGNDSCSLGTWVNTTYTYTDPTKSCPSGYKIQNDGNENQVCHRIANCSQYPPRQCPVEHLPVTYSCPATYTKINDDGEVKCRKVDVEGHYTSPQTKTETVDCELPEPDYGSCTPAGQCPTACGQPASEVSDGKGGTMSCSATPACEIDVCDNIEGMQTSLPEGYYYDDEHVCLKIEQPTPSPEPSPEPKRESAPSSAPSSPSAPSCGETAPVKIGANFHIYRKGDDAIAKWWPTEGNHVNIYYKQVNSPDWQYSVRDVDNSGYFEIHGLGSLDITFALQQSNGCAGGPLTNAVVDGPTKGWVLFR